MSMRNGTTCHSPKPGALDRSEGGGAGRGAGGEGGEGEGMGGEGAKKGGKGRERGREMGKGEPVRGHERVGGRGPSGGGGTGRFFATKGGRGSPSVVKP